MKTEQQIEKILSEDRSNKLDVIIQMDTNIGYSRYLSRTSQMISERRSIISARALQPPAFAELEERRIVKGRLRAKHRRRFPNLSPESDRGANSKGFTDAKSIRGYTANALSDLQDSEWFKRAVMTAAKAKERENPEQLIRAFSLSGSVSVSLTRDDLSNLHENIPSAAAVFPNRSITVPPIVQSDPKSPTLTDSKHYAWGIAKTGALATWGAFGVKGKGVKVAVLDTGIDPMHPDLVGKVHSFGEFSKNGHPEPILEGVENAYDDGRHGTHCAGTIVGGNASGRWIGMAPEAQVISCLVLKDGAGTDAQIIAGMEWAVAQGADVISMSLGGLRFSADVLDTYTRSIISINSLGIPVIVAVGNDGGQTTGSPGNDLFAYTVGAVDVNDRVAGFSGGRTQIIDRSRYISDDQLPLVYSKPDVSAPGVEVYSCVPGRAKARWESWNGTSMATPHVAGAMALLLSDENRFDDLDGMDKVGALQTLLSSTVKELGETGQDHRYGYGRIDILRAISYAYDLGYRD